MILTSSSQFVEVNGIIRPPHYFNMTMGSFVSRILQATFTGSVSCVATFVAAVLNHPLVQDAIANGIVAGMNAFAHQPNLAEHIMIMNETLSKSQRELARNAGEDFPVLVGNFFQGMIKPRRDKDGNPIQVQVRAGTLSPTKTQPQPQPPVVTEESSTTGQSTTDTSKSGGRVGNGTIETPPASPPFLDTNSSLSEDEKYNKESGMGLRKRSGLQLFGLGPKDSR